jgi:hypothetical protein
MDRYIIQHRIRTTMSMFYELECRGYQLRPIDQTVWGGILVDKEISAANASEAYKAFFVGLAPVLNAASVVTQCAVSGFHTGSYCIYKLSNNPENLALFYYAEPVETVGTALDKEEIADVRRIIEKIEGNEGDKLGIGYLRQANLASGPLFFLAMLVIAAEAFAGPLIVVGNCSNCQYEYKYSATNRKALESLLGSDVYKALYKGKALRHRLLHGGSVDESHAAKLAMQTYEKLLDFVKQKYGLHSVRKIVDAPRNTTFMYSRFFIKIEGGVDLIELEDAWKNKKIPVAAAPNDLASY